MKKSLTCVALAVAALLPLRAPSQTTAPPAPARKQVLFLGGSEYFAHDGAFNAMYTLAKLGKDSALFDVHIRTDFKVVTKQDIPGYKNAKNLNFYDAVMLYTQGNLPLSAQQRSDLLSFVKTDGKGLLLAHSGMDFNEWEFTSPTTMVIKNQGGWPEFIEMVGGAFVSHPWRQKVRIDVEDRAFPAMRQFPDSIELAEEIYQIVDYSRQNVRVLMSLDTSSVDMQNPPLAPLVRKDGDFPLAWVRQYGKGRVFVSTIGHFPATWDRPDIQAMWLEAVKWSLGLTDADATPRPKPAAAR